MYFLHLSFSLALSFHILTHLLFFFFLFCFVFLPFPHYLFTIHPVRPPLTVSIPPQTPEDQVGHASHAQTLVTSADQACPDRARVLQARQPELQHVTGVGETPRDLHLDCRDDNSSPSYTGLVCCAGSAEKVGPARAQAVRSERTTVTVIVINSPKLWRQVIMQPNCVTRQQAGHVGVVCSIICFCKS